MSKNIKAVPTQEYNAVIAVAQQYADSLKVGSADGLAEAFHKDAVMYGFTKLQRRDPETRRCVERAGERVRRKQHDAAAALEFEGGAGPCALIRQ